MQTYKTPGNLDCDFMSLFLQLWISRIAAATREHGMKYPALIHNLTKVVLSLFQRYVGPCGLSAGSSLCFFSPIQSSVQLNRRVISDLAITEPRTFQSLAKIAKARQQEGFRAALGDGKEPPGVLSRVVMLQ